MENSIYLLTKRDDILLSLKKSMQIIYLQYFYLIDTAIVRVKINPILCCFFFLLLPFLTAFYFLFRDIGDKDIGGFKTLVVTMMTLFQMTLGEFNYSIMNYAHYPDLTKFLFIVFMLLTPILLLNMLIAMMGNTYQSVIDKAEIEWKKQWAKTISVLERSYSAKRLREFQEEFSIPITKSGEKCDVGRPPRGLMVIKASSKTRAKQRKGALSNWKTYGKEVIAQYREYANKGKRGPFRLREKKKKMYVKDIMGNFVPAVEKKNDGIFSTLESAAWMEDIDIDKKNGPAGDNNKNVNVASNLAIKPTENFIKQSPTTSTKTVKNIESNPNITLPPLIEAPGLVRSNAAIKELDGLSMKSGKNSNPVSQCSEDTEKMSDNESVGNVENSSREQLSTPVIQSERKNSVYGIPHKWQLPGAPFVWSTGASDQCVAMEKEVTGTQYKVTDMKDFQPLDMDKIMSRRKKSAAHSETTCSSVSTFRSSSESSLRSSSPISSKFRIGNKIASTGSPVSDINDNNHV